MLIVMSGLPGSGKSTVAAALARHLPAVWLSVDPIESAMIEAGVQQGFASGVAAYNIAQRLGEEQLRLGHTVIADAVNDANEARQAWRDVAARTGAPMRIVECVCRDENVHRQRLRARDRGFAFDEPTLQAVRDRAAALRPWPEAVVTVDTVPPIETYIEALTRRLRDG